MLKLINTLHKVPVKQVSLKTVSISVAFNRSKMKRCQRNKNGMVVNFFGNLVVKVCYV